MSFVATRATHPPARKRGEDAKDTTEYLTKTGGWSPTAGGAQVFETADDAYVALIPHRYWYAVRALPDAQEVEVAP